MLFSFWNSLVKTIFNHFYCYWRYFSIISIYDRLALIFCLLVYFFKISLRVFILILSKIPIFVIEDAIVSVDESSIERGKNLTEQGLLQKNVRNEAKSRPCDSENWNVRAGAKPRKIQEIERDAFFLLKDPPFSLHLNLKHGT